VTTALDIARIAKIAKILETLLVATLGLRASSPPVFLKYWQSW